MILQFTYQIRYDVFTYTFSMLWKIKTYYSKIQFDILPYMF